MHKIRILVLLSQISAIFMAEYFDHSFRRQEDKKLRSESQSINKDSSKLLKRVGLAMGEEDSESSQPMGEHKLLRRTGLQEDQDAVESVKSGMKQSADGGAQAAKKDWFARGPRCCGICQECETESDNSDWLHGKSQTKLSILEFNRFPLLIFQTCYLHASST